MRGTAMALAAVATGLPDLGSNADPAVARALNRTLAPSITAGRRDLEHGVHRPYRIAVALVFDEAKAHVWGPAEIAIDIS